MTYATNDKYLIEAALSVLSGNYVILDEALSSPAQKAMASKAANSTKNKDGLTSAEQISKAVMPSDRINIPLDRTSTPDNRVVSHLKTHGYSIAGDYSEGLASHESTPNRKVRIGKILTTTEAPSAVKTAFDKDPARQGIKSGGTSVVITRKPSDVAAMSTHQNWQSCQTLGGTADKDGKPNEQSPGLYKNLVPGIVASGAHMAYLVHNPGDVDKHYKPIARTTLNAFKSPSGHTILRPSEEYGDHWEGFHSTVKNWAEKAFPAKEPRYIRHEGAYPEGEQSINNYSPEHNEYWKSQVYEAHQHENHPEPDVLKHYTDHAIGENSLSMMTSLIKNKHLPEESVNKIVSHVSRLKSTNIPMGGQRKSNLIKLVKNPEHIQKFLDNDMGSETAKAVSENGNATHEQLHHILDMHGASDNGHGGTMETGYHSYDIIRNVAAHRNADDSHFHKILKLEDLNSTDVGKQISSSLAHEDALEHVALKYHSEDIGKKILSMAPQMKNTSMIHGVALKHPHLLHSLPDSEVETAYGRHSLNKNLENEALRRSTPSLLSRVASKTSDRTLLNSMVNHHDPSISNNAKIRLKTLDSL